MSTPLGPLTVSGDEHGLSTVVFSEDNPGDRIDIPERLTDAVAQLEEYFSSTRTEFQLRLNPSGTEFQNKVWDHLTGIGYGKTISYQQLANKLGDPNVIRAAAAASGKNPIAIVIPCHRVIGSDGSLTGYAGGLQRKKWLLEHENPVKQTTLF